MGDTKPALKREKTAAGTHIQRRTGCLDKADHWMARKFFAIGVNAAYYPITYIVVSCTFALVLFGVGNTFFYVEESRGEKMWVPKD